MDCRVRPYTSVKKLGGLDDDRPASSNHKEPRNLHNEQLCAAGKGQQIFLDIQLNGYKVRALIDSGATGNFIHPRTIVDAVLPSRRKKEPYPLLLVDGEVIEENKGMVTYETDKITMTTLGGHSEEIQLDLVTIGLHNVILGMPWLRSHNPRIDWVRERITLDQCQCGSGRRAPRGAKEKTPPREELCATSPEETEDLAQASLLKEIPAEYKEYESLFQEGPTNEALPEHQPWDHEIPLEPGKVPPFGPLYQASEKELRVMKEYIDTNLAKGFIEESTSPCSCPGFFVPKAEDELRFVVDYRPVNAITIKDRYPLPLIKELTDRLNGARFFTSLDLRGAYNLIRMKKGEEWKTAFRTRYGLYQYKVMPFGISNAPATFQRMINNTLREYLDVFVVAYLDDILVFSKTKTEHIEHVRKVLAKLAAAKLLLKPNKCKFHKEEVKFLGFIVGRHGIKMDPEKIRAILEWPIPTTVKEVQAFLGFANFYRRFVGGYSKIAEPLTRLTKKDLEFEWTPAAQEAFDALRKSFTTAPVLETFEYDRRIVLETDASDFAIGACISQKHETGQLKPVAYYSRKLTPAELNYDVGDKEMLAIVEAAKQWRSYLEGAKYTIQVWTDHKNLTTFTTTKILNRRQVRWYEQLSTLDILITYRKGSENARADALSRRQDYSGKPTERPRALLKQGKEGLKFNHELLATISVVEDEGLEKRIKSAYKGDECAERILKEPTKEFLSDYQGLLRFKGLVYIPTSMRRQFTTEQHSLPAHGHQGINRTFERLARDYYFPQMRKVVEQVVTECDLCSRSKSSRHAPYGRIQMIPPPQGAWKSIAFDFIVKLPESKEPMTKVTYDAVWVVTCRLTKYAYFIPYKESSTAEELAYAFMRIVTSQHGLPLEIISDRDKLFTSKFWKSLMAQLGVNHKLSTAFHPQTDGQTERLNQTLEEYLRSYVNNKQTNWVELLPLAQLTYNGAKNETTGSSPFYANYGYEVEPYHQPRKDDTRAALAITLVAQLKELHAQLAKDIAFKALRVAKYADKKRSTEPSFQEGDRVYLHRKHVKTKRPSNKLDFKKLGPFRIVEKIGPVNYRLQLPETSRLHPVFHVSLLEPAKGDTPVVERAELQPENDPDIYEVERIEDARTTTKGQQEYLIKWKGYPHSENTWEPKKHLQCPELLKEFHLQRKSEHHPATNWTRRGPRDRNAIRRSSEQDRRQDLRADPRRQPPKDQTKGGGHFFDEVMSR